jgi:hypothetical protein
MSLASPTIGSITWTNKKRVQGMGHEFRIGVFAVCLLSTPVAVQAQVLDLDDPLDRSGRYENLFTVNADNGWRRSVTRSA